VDQGRSSAGSGVSSGTSLTTGAYSGSSYSSHNYTGYYSNMDYLPPPPTISQPNINNVSFTISFFPFFVNNTLNSILTWNVFYRKAASKVHGQKEKTLHHGSTTQVTGIVNEIR
jgi:hypothetical protein